MFMLIVYHNLGNPIIVMYGDEIHKKLELKDLCIESKC